MFSQGQWMFAVFFVIAFVIIMIISYRKDIQLHKKHYKGSLLILAGFLLFIAILFVIKTYLR
ncbi:MULTISPECIES: DUF3810 domain-containing protein [Mesonia]|uniref:Uncharacterized protein n=1 Tax=Mesonia oceanica TaxID=2687242 RepID=A0AC61Y7R6_9FLAO|nr:MULTISPECIES: DUF3810 domain-containing protein [Mesonia]MAN28181.1 hypothetical protein [Mesonia sp.]VVV00420.1 hypothetical protein FVB9532_01690 [Mesonia oceanica]|tara:strand:- start:192 stop:377 length:186 start_codon:yes stop_codon:yes gene_type:complete